MDMHFVHELYGRRFLLSQDFGGKESAMQLPCHRIQVRVSKSDSAFVYAILEAQEGWCLYSTLPAQNVHDRHRDLELLVTEPFVDRVLSLLREMDADVEILARPLLV